MTSTTPVNFYTDLKLYKGKLTELFASDHHFEPVPADWMVIITDIRHSTKAVEKGLHQAINLAATGSMIAALNIAKEEGIEIPFFYGGDGATLIVPTSISNRVMRALKVHQTNVKLNFDFDLRADQVPVSEIYEQGKRLVVAKASINEKYSIPVILGEGLIYADEVVKQLHQEQEPELIPSVEVNLEGMECRWDAVKPPEETKEVVCLILKSVVPAEQEEHYREALEIMERIYGPYEERKPITEKRLKLVADIHRFETEHKMKFGRTSFTMLWKSIIGFLVGLFYLGYRKPGKEYLKNLVQLTDTLVLDGKINTVITGTAKQRMEFVAELEKMEKQGKISFGLSVCSESIMSCYVQDRKDKHIHFIDGSDGGYTRAAVILKSKLANL